MKISLPKQDNLRIYKINFELKWSDGKITFLQEDIQSLKIIFSLTFQKCDRQGKKSILSS